MSKSNINEAAEMVMNAEIEALEAIKTKLDTLDNDLASILDTLPEKLSIDARRIVGEVRGALTYQRVTMIPMVLSKYAPAPEAISSDYTYTAPVPQA